MDIYAKKKDEGAEIRQKLANQPKIVEYKRWVAGANFTAFKLSFTFIL